MSQTVICVLRVLHPLVICPCVRAASLQPHRHTAHGGPRGALVVDVRRDFEWNRTHIPGAVHIPLEELPDRCPELPDDRLLITFCTGGIRSAGAANLLVENGFEAVNMSRGLVDRRAAGGPLTTR